MVPYFYFFFPAIALLFVMICDLIFSFIYSKNCKYDCKSCKYWPCPAHRCRKKRFK